MEENRLPIIRTWKTSQAGVEMLEREIENYSMNYECPDNEEFFKIVYDYLIEKKKFEGIEYRFLCWLNHKCDWLIKINTPYLVEPVFVDRDSFEIKYLSSIKKKSLFSELLVFIAEIKILAKVDLLFVLIGGSFVDESNSNPNDLDCVILLNEEYLNNFQLNENYLRSCEKIPKGVDMHFLPDNYTTKVFKAYSHIMYLGNKVEKKDGAIISNNQFEKRDIIKIEL